MDKTLLLAAVVIGLLVAAGVWLWTPDLPRARLEAAYLRAPSDMIEAGGARLHVRVDGLQDAPAVIMIHGFGSSLHTWEDWASVLSQRYRVVRYDLPGSGLSPPDPTGRYDDARAFELLLALMAHLDIDRATIIGNSVGGRIAWAFASEHPDRVLRLVLVAPDGFASAGFEYGVAPKVGPVTHAMRAVLPRFLVQMNLAQSFSDPARLQPGVVTRYFELLRAPGARLALIHRMEQTLLTDPRARLAALQTPVLLLWGEDDRLIPVANAQDYLEALPDAALAAMPGVGHLPQEEAPQASLAPVEAFLRAAGEGA
ncbi:MAG: alpha/beta fold hydrolase [Alphaproteobacteria bacterium]|nr:alpha/beta fold hydrolase [Alphaproteobacteria bacterium]